MLVMSVFFVNIFSRCQCQAIETIIAELLEILKGIGLMSWPVEQERVVRSQEFVFTWAL